MTTDSDLMKQKLSELAEFRERMRGGGGANEVEKQHKKGKLTSRERIEKLLDPGTFQELDLWGTPMATGFDIDKKEGPADGVAVGYGMVNGRPVCVGPADATA